MTMKKKRKYEAPELISFSLGKTLSVLMSFSTAGDGEDWDNGGSLDADIVDAIGQEDWDYGGGLGVD